MVIAVALALTGSTAAAPTSVVECQTLTEPGTYELAGDLLQEITGDLTSGSCLVIDSPDVTLLGNGNVIEGTGSASVGVEVRAHENVTVSNLTVEGFDSVGVWATGTTGFEARNLSLNATGTGLKIENGDAPTLTQVNVSNGTGDGIALVDTPNATVRAPLTRSNLQAGVHLRNASDATVRGFDSRADGTGVNVTDSAQVTVRNATVRTPAAQGIQAVASPEALLVDNTVRGAGLAGVLVRDAAARLERNLAQESTRGVVLEAANGSVSLNDTATGSLDGAGLSVEGARNVTVRGFNTTGNLVGASVREANNTRLDGVFAQRNDFEGVVVRASAATLEGVTARENGGGGVRVTAGSSGSGSNLTVRQNAVGLWLQSSPEWVAEGVVAADNDGSGSLNGSAVRVTGAPATVRGLELANGTPDVGNRTLDLRTRGIALAANGTPEAPAAHRYLGSALTVQNVSVGASAWVNASAAWSADEVDAYQVEEPRWQRWNGSAWEPVSGFNRAFPTDRRVAANATEFGVLAPLVRDDVTPPDATVQVNGTRGDNGWWVSLPNVRVNASDAYAGVASRELRVGGNWTLITDPVTLGEGKTVVRGRATDLAGNLELSDNRTVRVDIEPPRTNATAPTGWVNRTANVTLTASDAISGVNRTTWGLDDGDLGLYEGPVSVEPEGVHEIRYRSRDIAGISERIRNVTVRVDRTVPVLEASVSGNRTDDGEFGNFATVEVNASDALAGLNLTRVRVDGGPWRTYDGPIRVNETGNHTVTAEATDLAGNRELALVEFAVADLEPPTTSLLVDPSTPDGENGWYQTLPAFRLEPTPENATPEYRIDDGELQTYENPVQVPEGNHTIAYRSTHPIRPNESFNETQFRVDGTVPVLEASVSGNRTSDGEFAEVATVQVTASDALAGLNLTRVRVDGGPWRTYDGPIRVNGTGNHTVTAEATDLAGNRELTLVNFTVADLEPPTTSLLVDPSTPDGENGWYRTRPEFQLEPTPENATPEYRIDDGELRTYESPVQLPDGRYTVAYRSVHPIRPNESFNETQFRVDTQTPRVSVDAPDTVRPGERVRINVTASDATSGVRSIAAIRNDPERALQLEGENGSRVATFEAGAPGDVLVTVTARDRAGHVANVTRTVTVACPDGEVYRDGACESTSKPRVQVRTRGANTVEVAVENATGDDIRLVVVYPNGSEELLATGQSTTESEGLLATGQSTTGSEELLATGQSTTGSEEPVSTGQSATWNTTGLENGRYRIEARNGTNVTVASTSYLIERERASVEQASLAVGLGVGLSALVQLFSLFGQSFSVLGQSTAGLSGRAVRFVDLIARVIRRILSIEYREYTKDTAAIRRVRQTLSVGVAAAALASASTLAGLQPWTLPGFLSNLPVLGGAALLFSAVWYGGDWLVGQLTDENPEYVLLGSGLVSLLATTILFRSPFGTPGYVDRSGDRPASGSAREREEAARALADLGLVAVAALVFLPAMRLWIYGFGETGLLLVVMTLATGSVPVPPLPNYRVWRWNKPAALSVFALGIVLYVGWQLAILPDALVVAVGLAGAVTAGGFVTRRRGEGGPE
jgi:hypothetical protein